MYSILLKLINVSSQYYYVYVVEQYAIQYLTVYVTVCIIQVDSDNFVQMSKLS